MKMAVSSLLEAEVPGWADDDVRAAALFKAFSGQREDWQARLDLWKSLIVKVARHRGVSVVDAKEVRQEWFLRGGLLPLCLTDVLAEMLESGEVVRLDELLSARPLSFGGWILSGLRNLLGLHASRAQAEGKLVVLSLLEERITLLTKALADSTWKSECLLTIKCLVGLCGSFDEAQAMIHSLLLRKQALYLYIDGPERVEGFKVSLVSGTPVSSLSQSDYNMLQLYWTSEKMKQRFDLLEQQVTTFKTSATKSVQRGDKQTAKRYLKLMKITEASRNKCADFMEKIHQILEAISDAEATKKLADAIQIGNRAMKEHHISIDEVEEQLRELDESIIAEKRISEAIAEPIGEEDEALEEDFAKLEEELAKETQLIKDKVPPGKAASIEEVARPEEDAARIEEVAGDARPGGDQAAAFSEEREAAAIRTEEREEAAAPPEGNPAGEEGDLVAALSKLQLDPVG